MDYWKEINWEWTIEKILSDKKWTIEKRLTENGLWEETIGKIWTTEKSLIEELFGKVKELIRKIMGKKS